jgi:hypothetical protein
VIVERAPRQRLYPRPIGFGEFRRRVAIGDMNSFRAFFIHQGCPLERALPAADDQDALAAIKFKIHRVAGMRV